MTKRHIYLLLFPMLLCVVSQVQPQAAGTLRFPESRSVSPGKLWLDWGPSERTGFVRGFLVGYDDGYRRACLSEADISKPSVAGDLEPRLEEQHLFHKGVHYYQRFLSDFYTQYSEDRDIPFREILLQADRKTPKEVHDFFVTKSSK